SGSPTGTATSSPAGRVVPPVGLAPTGTPASTPKTTTRSTPTGTPRVPPSPPTGPAAKYPGATPDQLAVLTALDCTKTAVVASDPNKPIAACDREGKVKYILDRSLFPGTEVASAVAQAPDANNNRFDWTVGINLKSSGQARWSKYTAEHNARS